MHFALHGLTVIAAAGWVLVVPAVAAATDESSRQSAPPPVRKAHEEPPDDPWLPQTESSVAPGGRYELSGFTSIQVNVDSQGRNIRNDAANEPSIATDPRNPNRIAIGWRQFDTISSNFRQAGVAYSRDGGRTWTFRGVLDRGVFRSDPVLRASEDGRIYYYSLTINGLYTCDTFFSDDGGRSWVGPIEAYGGDKAWIAIDRTGGIGDGNFYAAWDYAGCCGSNVFTRSTDGGVSYMYPIPIPNRPDWGTVTVGPDGAVYVGGNRAGDLSRFSVAKSSNAKDGSITPTWDFTRTVTLGGRQVFYESGNPNPGGLLGQVWLIADRSGGPRNGYLYMLCSVDPPGSDPMDVMFARSTDGGNSWSAPVKVNSDEASGTNAWQWFGTMGVSPNGRIDVVWNDTKNTRNVRLSELRYAYSQDGGLSWSQPATISPVFDSWVGWPQQNKLGDYYDIESDRVGAHVAYAATFNGEQDVYYLRIGDYDCNGNGVGDARDISGNTSRDLNGNGIPDECECIGDINDDLTVGHADLAALLAAFGTSQGDPGFEARADLNRDGRVNQADLALLLSHYGEICR